MKKNVLASSVAAAVLGLGMAGAAHASNILVVPYFTAQGSNATLLNIVNTDTTKGKAVKVRFRGAANSDDVFDFQVFLSPGDVWTGQVAQGANGVAQLTTNDASCTKPAKAVLNSTPFVTSRLNPALTAEQKAEQTREGYVELFVMADIVKTGLGDDLDGTEDKDKDNDLYQAIKHVNGVAPCSGKAWTGLDTAVVGGASTTTAGASVAAGGAKGLSKPTGGLFANYTIINLAQAGAWDGEAVVADTFASSSVGEIPYWPQTAAEVEEAEVVKFSADPLFTSAAQPGTTSVSVKAAIKAGSYDLPDLSTPYTQIPTPGRQGPIDQALLVSGALATQSVTNEFLVDADIQATTDWVFTMPSRRYWVAMNYAAANAATTAAPDDGRRFTDATGNFFFNRANSPVSGGLICVSNVDRDIWDQEERRVTETTEVVVSPSTLPPATLFCGEASVLSVNAGGTKPTPTLGASVAVTDIDVPYKAGWMKLTSNTSTRPFGLPVVGQSFTRAIAGDSFFAGSWAHRTDRGID